MRSGCENKKKPTMMMVKGMIMLVKMKICDDDVLNIKDAGTQACHFSKPIALRVHTNTTYDILSTIYLT